MKKCPKCGTQHSKPGKFCSRTCANSRGQRTEEFKKIVSEKLTGRKIPREIIEKTIKSKNQISSFGLPNTLCKICGKDTGSKTRKTCSKECYSKLCKLQSQQNPKCGGQKHTHRSKIKNINGDVFISESSFEAKLSEILNSLGILWIRPNFVLYLDNDHNQRRYYPDFYLPEFNIYIDTKNDYLIKTDIDKIFKSSKQNNIKIVILGEKYITEDCIKSLVGDDGNAPPYPVCKTGVLLLN
jgi:hypothetical protein